MRKRGEMLIDNFKLETIPHSKLRDIYQYWLDKRGDRLMPLRSDISPMDIPRLLPNITLVTVVHDTNRYKMRLVGGEIANMMGGDVTGKYLDEMPEIEKYLKARYDWIVKAKRPYIYSDQLNWAGKKHLNFHSIGLPLSLDGETVDILLYYTHFEYPSGDAVKEGLSEIKVNFDRTE